MSKSRYAAGVILAMFAGWLLHDIWQAPHHGWHGWFTVVTVGGPVTVSYLFGYLMWRRQLNKNKTSK